MQIVLLIFASSREIAFQEHLFLQFRQKCLFCAHQFSRIKQKHSFAAHAVL